MAAHRTHKSTAKGKATTLARRRVRAYKTGAVRTTRAGRIAR